MDIIRFSKDYEAQYKELKREINLWLLSEISIPLSDRISRQKISKDTHNFNQPSSPK